MGCSPPGSLGPWNFPGKNTGAGCHFLLQGIFPAQGSNPHILCTHIGRQVLYHCTNLEAPKPSQHSLNHPRLPQFCWINYHHYPPCPQHCFREGFLETDSEMYNCRQKVYLDCSLETHLGESGDGGIGRKRKLTCHVAATDDSDTPTGNSGMGSPSELSLTDTRELVLCVCTSVTHGLGSPQRRGIILARKSDP